MSSSKTAIAFSTTRTTTTCDCSCGIRRSRVARFPRTSVPKGCTSIGEGEALDWWERHLGHRHHNARNG
eukprot:12918658-Prorocentrum_lima.AAC.1